MLILALPAYLKNMEQKSVSYHSFTHIYETVDPSDYMDLQSCHGYNLRLPAYPQQHQPLQPS